MTQTAAQTRRQGLEACGTPVQVASTLADVTAAWRLVYDVYRRAGLIDANPFEVHTSPSALTERAAVMYKAGDGQVQSTMTAVADGPEGLPLDVVFPHTLGRLRREGRRVVEIGLFADRRANDRGMAPGGRTTSQASRPLIDLMGWAVHYAWRYLDASDVLVGVHPRHARFYCRALGLEQCGETRPHPTVRHHPVVMLRGTAEGTLGRRPLPAGMQKLINQPVDVSLFDTRYRGWFLEIDFLFSQVYGFASSQSGEPALAG